MMYMLICNNCGQKHFTDGSSLEGLVEIKAAPLPKNANGINKDICELPKKFKCYNCGMLFKVVKLASAKEKIEPIVEEDFPSGDEYFKYWEKESLRSSRKHN